MNAAEIQKATNEELLAEFLRRHPLGHGCDLSIVRRNKNVIVFLITRTIDEGDSSWEDDTFVHVVPNLYGQWNFFLMEDGPFLGTF